ncbi:MAG: Na+/H+ antiporter subunit E [Desulfobulbaceae bacterium]|jgi:multicomponent Na+:H+ antiporter subunit E|nr:Na+/H+ antiporter subunit E [Desulfobulbaceae bacterium]
MNLVINFILLFTTWLLFSGKFDLFHLALGGVSCFIVALFSTELLFENRQKGIAARLGEAGRFIFFSGWLLYQIVLANFHVIKLALSPRSLERDLDPHIFTFKTSLKTTFAKFVLANSITLTPGTVTIRIHGDIFHIHAISQKAMGDLANDEQMSEMEKRVAWVFEGGRR